MRISEIELQCEDIIWFGVDKYGHIFACASGGCGCVPEFVCKSREETKALDAFFSEQPKITEFNTSKNIDVFEDAEIWAEKGIFFFDVDYDDNYGNSYIKLTWPSHAMLLEELPEHIRNILISHSVDVDVSVVNRLIVSHAYT